MVFNVGFLLTEVNSGKNLIFSIEFKKEFAIEIFHGKIGLSIRLLIVAWHRISFYSIYIY